MATTREEIRGTDIHAEAGVGQIAAAHPEATRVFARHDIDFCCGGGRTLRESCDAKGIDVETVLAEIRSESSRPDDPLHGWDTATPAELIEHIIGAYHEPLREELPRLEAMARKVARVHGQLRPVTLDELSHTVTDLKVELERHMMEEEQDVFPAILRDGPADEESLEHLEDDHAEAGAALERIRQLTGDYELPAEACTTWTALWHGLEDLERTMHEHVHLENNVLFPRVRGTP